MRPKIWDFKLSKGKANRSLDDTLRLSFLFESDLMLKPSQFTRRSSPSPSTSVRQSTGSFERQANRLLISQRRTQTYSVLWLPGYTKRSLCRSSQCQRLLVSIEPLAAYILLNIFQLRNLIRGKEEKVQKKHSLEPSPLRIARVATRGML